MIGVLIVTHGSIGESLLASAKQILDDEPPLTATLGVSRNDDPDDLILRAKRLLKQLDTGDGVLVLTDIFGATPGNAISHLLDDGHIEGVSGISLPMLLRVLNYSEQGLAELAQTAADGARAGVRIDDA